MSRNRVRGASVAVRGWWFAIAAAALAAIAVLLVTQLAGPPSASATRGLTTGFLELDPAVQADAEMVRINARWRSISPQRPANPSDPADPAYDFSDLDDSVRDAQAQGLGVLFTIQRAPNWAEGPGRPGEHQAPAGTWDPDPEAFGQFGQALATRYSGSFGGLNPLPRVRYYEVWNEPNLTTYLGPQWARGKARGKARSAKSFGKPHSPKIYRKLLNSFYDGVKAVSASNIVVAGSTAPYGDQRGRPRMRPLLFLRDLFCLKGRRKLKPKKRCQPAKLDVLSHHPINFSGGPRKSAIHPDDATTGDVRQVKRILRAAEKGGKVQPRGKRPLWATEFWWLSDPTNSERGVALPKHARWVEETLYLLWKQGVTAAFYYRLRDSGDADAATGLFFKDGTPKPAVKAFQFPFVADRRTRSKVRAWGKAPAAGTLQIQQQSGGQWKTIKQLPVQDGAVFNTTVRVRGKATLRAVLGAEQSLDWKLRR